MSAIGERIRDKMEDWGLSKYVGGGGASGGAASGRRSKVIIAVVALALAALVIGWQLFPSGSGGAARSVSTPTISWVDNARQKLYEAGLADKRFTRISLDVVGAADGKEEVLIYGSIPSAAAEAPLKELVGKLSPPFSVRYQLEIDGQRKR